MIPLRFNNFKKIFLLISIQSVFVIGQDCDSKETCEDCIEELNCFWCTSPQQGANHCLNRNNGVMCLRDNVEDPQQYYEILESNILTESNQISPQRVQLKLRKNEKFQVKFQYRQSANYPVDLYYLMDMSHSMEPSKHQLAILGDKLADEMQSKTNKFQIGFGSFVDKLTLPYVNTSKSALEHPCTGCDSPHSFKNHLSLNNNSKLFSQMVARTPLSGNLDTPEGGFDAIMQAIVCKNEIGWRSNARHLLVMSTDAESHIAGDGKFGGIIEPNDATCHMENHAYTADLLYDYPSVSQINYVARQNNINLIFAIVTRHTIYDKMLNQHYEGISRRIENSKTGNLDNKSDNVVKFISDIYDEIRDSVRITSNADKDLVVNITANCSNTIDGGCTNVKLGQTIDFTATIEPLSCQSDGNLNKKIIKIKPEGLEDELIVELEVLCKCGCEKNRERNHATCSNEGALECGICRCNPGRFGLNCQCDRTNSYTEDPSLCIKPGDIRNETCSSQGKCICGKCACKERPDKTEIFYGKYCECDNFSCPKHCSGRGKCDCGKCNCENGWSGEGCDCSTDQSQCIPTKEMENGLCSGNGECVCGLCQCNSTGDVRYSGKYCEECTNCPAQRCEELSLCVECQTYGTGEYGNSTACAENCQLFNTNIVKELSDNSKSTTKRCRIAAEAGCSLVFEYDYDDQKNLVVTAPEKKVCSDLPPILVYILGVIGLVLLIGILTLIVWKILTTIHDKREYARFINENDKTKWSAGQNPLYKPGTTHFKNPAYKRASQRTSALLSKKAVNVKEDQL